MVDGPPGADVGFGDGVWWVLAALGSISFGFEAVDRAGEGDADMMICEKGFVVKEKRSKK